MRRLGPDEGEVLRVVRLAALAADPAAFASTLAREEALGPDDWARRVRPPSTTFVVVPAPDAAPVGMAWAVPDADDAERVDLFGMWVAPAARGSGAADALIAAVVDQAAEVGAARVELTVVEGNDRAERLYHRHGFRRTGAVARNPVDDQDEATMALALGAPTGGWALVLGAHGLEADGPPVLVGGGGLHRTWRVPTTDGVVAVKALAAGGHAGWDDDVARAVAFEAAAWRAGTVPMAEPLPAVDGSDLVRIDGDVVRAHRWVEGPAGTAVAPTADRLRRLGRTLAALVAVAPAAPTTGTGLAWNALDAYDATVAEAREVGAPFATDLAALGEEVDRLRARMAALEACRRPMVMGHGDLHPRNSVVVDGADVLLDWDAAAPVVPASHLLDGLIAFAGGPHDAPPDLVRAGLAGWSEAGGGPLDLDGASTPVANAGLRTVLFHAWRALGHRPVTPAARAASAALVPTLAAEWSRSAPTLRTWEHHLGTAIDDPL